ncbi:NAD-dependent dehydratase [Pandoraea soli]|uniref:NAD-dependent dehydratase n=2 Tax=Pandoraea soli TaxID=2508293 RepID=A0ABY6W6G4_9BURK|nr:SDR family oxidoreductase [Pandoraea soli]VVE32319.1 NAD-dependent dehydratase [Pandoraea soli]
MVSILVTGASGMVGAAVVERLQRDVGIHVAGAVRREVAGGHLSNFRITGDIGPETDWTASLSGVDVVIHCAARVHVMGEHNGDEALRKFREVNVAGTERLAQACARAGVRRLVFVSSVKVNGESTSQRAPFRHDDPPAPQDAYGISKWEAEASLWGVSKKTGLEVVVVRPPLVYGPGVKANFLRLMQAVARGVPLPFGAVRNLRSMVYVANLSDLLAVAATHPGAAGHTFMVSDGDDLSTRRLIEGLAKAMGVRPRLLPVPCGWMRASARILGKAATSDRVLGSLQVDIEHTRRQLGWNPPCTVHDGLQETVAAWRNSQC